MDSTIISPRSLSATPNSSKSGGNPPGPIPMMKRPCERWSNIAACPAISAGWYCDMQMTPVASLMRRVRAMRLAMNSSGEVIGSTDEQWCSPTQTSSKPSRSASSTASTSSSSDVW